MPWAIFKSMMFFGLMLLNNGETKAYVLSANLVESQLNRDSKIYCIDNNTLNPRHI